MVWRDVNQGIIGIEGDEISYTKEGKLKVGSQVIENQKSKSKDEVGT